MPWLVDKAGKFEITRESKKKMVMIEVGTPEVSIKKSYCSASLSLDDRYVPLCLLSGGF